MKPQLRAARNAATAANQYRVSTERNRQIWINAGMGTIGPHPYHDEWQEYYTEEKRLNRDARLAFIQARRVATRREWLSLARFIRDLDVPDFAYFCGYPCTASIDRDLGTVAEAAS